MSEIRSRMHREAFGKYHYANDQHADDTPRFNDLLPGLRPVRCASYQRDPAPDLADVLAAQHLDHPWLLTVYEPILTKAPSPSRCQPHCCYIRTVIFYARPYIVAPPKPYRSRDGALCMGEVGSFVEYDHVETRLLWDDVVSFNGHDFVIGGGSVIWERRRWWMRRDARRRAA